MLNIDDALLNILKQKLEKKYGIGTSEQWTHQDFINICENIYEKTKIKISSHTIKRLYGKVPGSLIPRSSTLDGICKYIGFKGWYDFQLKNPLEQKNNEKIKHFNKKKISYRYSLKNTTYLIIPIIIILLTLLFFKPSKDYEKIATKNKSKKYTFDVIERIGEIPFLFKIKLDLKNLEGDSLWLKLGNRNIQLSKTDTLKLIYLRTPGIILVNLMQQKHVLKSIPVLIETNGDWVAYNINQLYFRKDIQQDSTILLSEEKITNNFESNIDKKIKNNIEVYYIYAKNSNINLNSFTLTTRYRYCMVQNYDLCSRSYFTVTSSNGSYISIPLAHKSCFKFVKLHTSKKKTLLNDNNIGFYTKPNEWNTLNLIKRENIFSIYKNNTLIYQDTINANWGTLYQINYHFLGNGEIDFINIFDENNRVLFKEDFNQILKI